MVPHSPALQGDRMRFAVGSVAGPGGEAEMKAVVGDRLVINAAHVDGAVRDG